MNKLFLLTIITLLGTTLGTYINKEIICFNNINTKITNYRLSQDYLEKCKMISEKIYYYDLKQKKNDI